MFGRQAGWGRILVTLAFIMVSIWGLVVLGSWAIEAMLERPTMRGASVGQVAAKQETSNKPTSDAAESIVTTTGASPSTPAVETQTFVGTGKTIVIDAGHQSKADLRTEPIGPGSGQTKPRVAGGATGVYSRIPEYKLNLKVAKKLESELLSRGYTVKMVRTTNNVDISNSERSTIANNLDADLLFRVHANGSPSSKTRGFLTMIPASNKWTKRTYSDSKRAGVCVHKATLAATGAKDAGLVEADNMAGFNWSKVPCIIVEMGFLSNKTDDELLNEDAYQDKLVRGFAEGIDDYFRDK